MLIKRKQTTSQLLMIRPANFGFNPETAESNAFQQKAGAEHSAEISEQAIREFDAFVAKLHEAGIQVIVVKDTAQPIKTDAVFPNNWVSSHSNGTVVTYSMCAPSRRTERRDDILNALSKDFDLKRRVDFSHYESQGKFLEGTGSLIFDRVHRLVYACLSPRTSDDLLDEFCEWAEYEKIRFRAVDAEGIDIYHTNVMMAVGDQFVVICLDTIRDEQEKARLHYYFRETGKEIIEISLEQMNQFAGNMLQVENADGESFMVMSEQAFKSLNDTQVKQIEHYARILHSPIYTIEKYGGGSARCMMAEIFLAVRV